MWTANLASIQEHNKKAEEHGFTLEMNRFGDLTDEEFNHIYNGYRMTPRGSNRVFEADPGFFPSNSTAIDWRKEGVVTPVKNQGDCGSCWAFSATGSLEAQHHMKGNPLVALSEQNLMDCSTKYGNLACLGGTMDKAFEYIIDNHGIDTEQSYPYLAQTEKQCRFKPGSVGATMTSFVDVPVNEFALVEACQKVGPISIAMDAGLMTFRFYKSGIYYEPQCSTTRLNHGVLLVGFGVDPNPIDASLPGKDYYLIKNSWGVKWGMEGYFKMARNRDNNCGIATNASYPVV